MSLELKRTGSAGPAADQRVDERARDIHVGDRVAELVLLRGLQLDRPLADDRPLMPAGARWRQLAEEPFQQLALKQPQAFGVSRKLPAFCSSPCCSAISRR